MIRCFYVPQVERLAVFVAVSSATTQFHATNRVRYFKNVGC
jgi:hypothetical protein